MVGSTEVAGGDMYCFNVGPLDILLKSTVPSSCNSLKPFSAALDTNAEVGKVTLKSNGDEALSDESL
jgi:hypothetical protein